MPEFSVAAYTVKVRPRTAPATSSNYRVLSDFDSAGSDLLQFLHAYFKAAQTVPIRHKSEDRYLQVMSTKPVGRVLRAEVDSGSHGFMSRLVDVDDHSQAFKRLPNHAELLPIRNLFAIPLNKPVGLFITERIGIRGIKSTLVPSIERSFSDAFPDFTVDVSALAPEQAVKESLQEGQIKGIRLVKYGIPEDLANQYHLGKHEDVLGSTELSLKPGRGRVFSRKALIDVLEASDKAGLLQWGDTQYDDMKVEVAFGKQTRTVTVTKQKTPRVTFPFAEDAATDQDGRPTDSEFFEHAKKIAGDLGHEIGIPREKMLDSDFEWTDAMLQELVKVRDVEG